MGKAYYSLARMCISTENYRQGIDYSKQAIALLEPTSEQSWLGMAYTTLGSNYGSLAQFKQAMEAEHQALAIGKAIGDRRLQTNAANLICNCNAWLGNHEAAIEAGQLAIKTAPDPYSGLLHRLLWDMRVSCSTMCLKPSLSWNGPSTNWASFRLGITWGDAIPG